MSVVSGIATASGVSSLLNAPGGNKADVAKRTGGAPETAATNALRIDHTITRIVERLTGVDNQPTSGDPNAAQANVIPGSGRYSRFVEAVQALRLDEATAAELTPERVAQLKAAAAEVFNMRSDIPRELRPVEIFEEQRQADVQREAIEKAERDQAAEQVADSERAQQVAIVQGDHAPQEQTAKKADIEIGADVPEIAKPEVAAKPVPKVPDTSKPEPRVPGSQSSGDTSTQSVREDSVPDNQPTASVPAAEPA